MKKRMARPAAVIGGTRIPFCRVATSYADASNQQMLTHTLGALVEQYGLQGERLGEVALGAVMKHSSDWNLAREVALGSGLSPTTPGITLQRACGTSLDASIIIANKIAAGQIESGIAGGSDTASDVPIVFQRKFARRLLAAARARSFMDRLRAFKGFRPGELKPSYPAVSEPRTGMSMGEHTERMAKEWGITREAQDQFAFDSHRKAARAFDDGFFDDLVTPFRGVERDNILRPDTTPDKMATTGIRPVRPGHPQRRQLHAAHRRRKLRAAGLGALGQEAQAPRARLPDPCEGGRGGLRSGRGAAHGAHGGHLGNAEGGGAVAAGLRFLRDPRGLRRPGALHAGSPEVEGLLPRQAGTQQAAG